MTTSTSFVQIPSRTFVRKILNNYFRGQQFLWWATNAVAPDFRITQFVPNKSAFIRS